MKKINNFFKKDWFIIVLILLSFGIGLYFYPSLPDQVPTHWNIKGEVDGYGSKFFGAFGIPLMNLCLYLMFIFLPYMDPKRKNYDSFKSTYQLFKYIMVIFMIGVQVFTILTAIGIKIDVTMYICVGVSILFILMGNAMGRIKHNYFVGIKTPWTLSNEEVWKKTHRFAGPLWVVCGIFNLILALSNLGMYGILITLFPISIGPIVYSYIIHRKIAK